MFVHLHLCNYFAIYNCASIFCRSLALYKCIVLALVFSHILAHRGIPVEDAKQKYFAKIGRTLLNPSTGSKLYWSLVNKMLNKAKIPEIPPLIENGVFVLDFASKTQIFND